MIILHDLYKCFWVLFHKSLAANSTLTGKAARSEASLSPVCLCAGLGHLMSFTSSSHPKCPPRKQLTTQFSALSDAACKLWNSLSVSLRECGSDEAFEKSLKTNAFSENQLGLFKLCASDTWTVFLLLYLFSLKVQ